MSRTKQASMLPKIVFFTDFDGTITTTDSNDYLVAKLGYGDDLLNQSNLDVLEGRVPLRDALVDQMHSINRPLEECIDFQCQFIELDPHFVTFYHWAKVSNIPVIILSGGIRPLIRALLTKLLGREEALEIELVSNEVEEIDSTPHVNDRRNWKVKLHDESDFGFDKAAQMKKHLEKLGYVLEGQRPALFFAGDGVSDLCAARACDLLFAKSGKDLVKHCEKEGIAFTTFNDWAQILQITRSIHNEEAPIIAARAHNRRNSPLARI